MGEGRKTDPSELTACNSMFVSSGLDSAIFLLECFTFFGLMDFLTESPREGERSNVIAAVSTMFPPAASLSFKELRSARGCLRLSSMEKVWVWCCYGVSAIIFSVSYAVSVLFLAIVGSTLGAFTGVLLGMKSQGGLFSRMVVGAVAGSVLSINAFKTSVSIWLSDDGSFQDVLQWTDSTTDLDVEELVRQFLYNLVLSRIEQTLAHADNMISEITVDRAKVSKNSFNQIGRFRITEDHLMDSSGNRNSCSICLQDFECKDVAKRLPSCGHLFHLHCIDKWISKQRSCPLCRSPIVRVN
ncbi:hypothetical protein NL676_027664 [Syzygium grande]|nr:hypothetical protein NL676_027664 [Syzygium grande]